MLLAESDVVLIVNTVANVVTALIVTGGTVLSAYIAYRMAVLAARVKATASTVEEVKKDVKEVKTKTDGMQAALIRRAEDTGFLLGKEAERLAPEVPPRQTPPA